MSFPVVWVAAARMVVGFHRHRLGPPLDPRRLLFGEPGGTRTHDPKIKSCVLVAIKPLITQRNQWWRAATVAIML
jgi:hypothetical protein